MSLENIDPEWAYGAVGKAAGCLVRLREAKEAERLAAIAHVAASGGVTTAQCALDKANAQLADLVHSWADHKQGADDIEGDGVDRDRMTTNAKVVQRVKAMDAGLATVKE